jgi:hypothetical protein
LAFLLAGCGNAALPSEESSSVVTDEDGKDDRYCRRRGWRCWAGGTPCCTGFCDDVGYGWGYCRAPLAAGESCSRDEQCQRGLFCDNQGYAAWVCAAPRADGEFCTVDKQCATGSCVDYVCGGPRCAGLGAPCESSGECCEGYCETYRVYSLDYHTCLPQLSDGSYCNYDRECVSGRCLDSRCASASCSERCSADADCCPGFYCSTWTSYGPTWYCAAKLRGGDGCVSHSECLSNRCTDHRCQ